MPAIPTTTRNMPTHPANRSAPIRRGRLAAAAFAAGPLIFLAGEAITARAWKDPRYSYRTNWISDLGVPDPGNFQGRAINSPLHLVINTAFLLNAITLLIGVFLLAPALSGKTRRAAQILAVVTAAGYSLVATTHTSTAAQASGTIAFHFTGAFLAILGGNALGIVLGRYWWKTTTPRGLGHFLAPAGTLGLLAATTLAFTAATHAPNGLIERISVYTILAWQLRLALQAANINPIAPPGQTLSTWIHRPGSVDPG